MSFVIRQEEPADFERIRTILTLAFAMDSPGTPSEPKLVDRLRKGAQFIPELALVAQVEGQVVGHILFTPIQIVNQSDSFPSLALAPVVIHPDWQRKGIGTGLIREGHRRAKQMGFSSVVLVGHAEYYPRLGYRKADQFQITVPFEVPPEAVMAIELTEGGLGDVHGRVQYPAEFFGEAG